MIFLADGWGCRPCREAVNLALVGPTQGPSQPPQLHSQLRAKPFQSTPAHAALPPLNSGVPIIMTDHIFRSSRETKFNEGFLGHFRVSEAAWET